MNTSRTSAPRASSKSRAITRFQEVAKTAAIIATSFLLWSCASGPGPVFVPSGPVTTTTRPGDDGSLPPSITQAKSRWVPVRWSDLPGFDDDKLFEAWNAWLKSCERPGATFAPLCGEVRRLSIASAEEQRAWMTSRLRPYRVESLNGPVGGQLTSYYEPLLKASRQQGPGYDVPLYRTPAGLGSRKPWYSRQEIDTLPEARAALRGREIAWLADPVDAMSLHIQGSGRLSVLEPDGSQRVVRVAFAGTNDQPFRSPTQWLTERGVRIGAPWTESTKAWAAQNPQSVQTMLWTNPRYVFFREEPLSELDAAFGPRGAQGVALTPGRSIAVDPGSIPYGTPVWLASRGSVVSLQRLVFAQDTGSAIVGAVRADYFAGTGPEAGEFASRMNQPLQLWVLWPR
ncbi:MAG: MltA domain-containing protein [Polaromonas sp.]|uniref:murein transglycosylase A n=1 Tax=Polaromonas sp. TaxID=1869339 RepID=UPI0025F4BCA1|nr:MltA domain-containing protein [Polaromonas sp.]MBI2725751.1 MltA domain-containing protein [Polaromonas sp.]